MTLRRLTISIFLAIPVALSAMGHQDDPIDRAAALVEENRINEAILLLEQTVRDDPERILEAEDLMQRIREIRGEYNLLFGDLIENLVNNPDDIARTLEIIDRMERLDEFPNERTRRQVENARIVAQLAFDRNLVNQLMDEARDLVAANDYAAAVDRFLAIQPLQRDQFEERGFGEIFEATVGQRVAEIETLAQVFREQYAAYREAGSAVAEAGSTDMSDVAPATLATFYREGLELDALLATGSELSVAVEGLVEQVALQFPDNPVDWHVTFQNTIVNGRADRTGDEGLLHSIDHAYNSVATQLLDQAGEQTRAWFAQGRQAQTANAYIRAAEAYRNAATLAGVWRQLAAFRLTPDRVVPELALLPATFAAGEADQLASAQAYAAAALSLEALSGILADSPAALGTPDDSEAILVARSRQVSATLDALEQGRTAWQEERAPFLALPQRYLTSAAQTTVRQTDLAWQAASNSVIDATGTLVTRIAALRTDGVPESVEQARRVSVGVDPLLEGRPVDGDDEDGRLVRSPEEAREQLVPANQTLVAARERVADAQAQLAQEPPAVLALPQVVEEQERLSVLLARVDEALAVNQTRLEEAEALIAEALDLRRTGNERIADTRAAIAAQQAEAARANLEAAQEAYVASLQRWDDPTFRDQADATIEQVALELRDLENILVVRRVRELLNQADTLYNQDRYTAARDTLLVAQETWETTNIEPNPEIDRLLRLVLSAINLEEGRELLITDPLYPILGNYLSLAREDITRARDLFEAGRRADADRLFDRAIANLRNIREVRPLNWDARILELEIARLRNPDTFDEIFATRFNQAVGRLDSASPLEVYSELEVLAEINPDYPGLQEQIRRLEIALNLRPDPLSQARIAEANQLITQARSLSRGTRDQVVVAVSLLEEAVDLNPADGDAKFLLDELRIQLGGQAAVALATEDEQEFRRAQTLLSQGQALQALSIVERLLQNATNASYPPLIDLRRRIALRLGI